MRDGRAVWSGSRSPNGYVDSSETRILGARPTIWCAGTGFRPAERLRMWALESQTPTGDANARWAAVLAGKPLAHSRIRLR